MINYIDDRTELDIKSAFSLFVVFLVALCFSAWIVSLFSFETKIFDKELTKHLSEIMTEHEAGKSMFVLSIFALLFSYSKYLFSLKWGVNPFLNKYLVLAPTNFLVSLVFVELAVTYSVVIMVPKSPIPHWDVLLYLGGKNTVLGIALILSLAVINKNSSLNINKTQQFFLSVILAGIYFWALTW
ncbi:MULTISPECIES: hypothetical protein [unclassified Pseudoalteromonas]|uniref:hypothetical protein n=1 Tax=unclassified Pseudoalteromonas TaxID=194690 RepID=UPI000409B758|nr:MULTISPECIES: hypothetical protein [unclassified Pseudoalteromonas]